MGWPRAAVPPLCLRGHRTQLGPSRCSVSITACWLCVRSGLSYRTLCGNEQPGAESVPVFRASWRTQAWWGEGDRGKKGHLGRGQRLRAWPR